MRNITIIASFIAFLFISCSNDNTEKNDIPAVDESSADDYAMAWITKFDKSMTFQKVPVSVTGPSSDKRYLIRFSGTDYQTIDGFGAAITQASCYNLLKMTSEERIRILKEMFSPEEGAGSSLIRVCIGGSDFSMDEFTCCDSEGIWNFAMHELDSTYLFPVLDEIYAINPDVKIIGSPWSCPRWMKMNLAGTGEYDRWTSGRLDPEHYGDYAVYFVKWIQAMEARGYKILAVTPQNEPLNHGNSMSLYMPWEDQRDFIKVLGPELEASGLKTKILVFDHNYDYDEIIGQELYPLKIFADAEASRFIAGSAWHNYGGKVSELDEIRESAPDKDIYFTEASIGSWNHADFGNCFRKDMKNIFLGTLTRGCKGVTLWNLMLDNDNRPYRPGGCSTCYGACTVQNTTYSLNTLTRNSHWYDILQCSMVVRPGAVRTGTEGFTKNGITYSTFRNPDGSYGAIFLNENAEDQKFVFDMDSYSINFNVPGESVLSLKWKQQI